MSYYYPRPRLDREQRPSRGYCVWAWVDAGWQLVASAASPEDARARYAALELPADTRRLLLRDGSHPDLHGRRFEP